MPAESSSRRQNATIDDDASARVERGSDNVFADLGLPNPEVALAKAELVRRIRASITERKLTQAGAGKLLGLDQPKVSALMRGRVAIQHRSAVPISECARPGSRNRRAARGSGRGRATGNPRGALSGSRVARSAAACLRVSLTATGSIRARPSEPSAWKRQSAGSRFEPMSKTQRNAPRKPATKLPNLRKKLERGKPRAKPPKKQ